MAEIPGIVLGGIPVVLWALDRYHEPVKSYLKYDITLSTLRSNIFMQQQQLHLTLGLIGLKEPSVRELRECLEEKYPDQHMEYMSVIENMDRIIKGLLDKLEVDMDRKPLWTDEPPNRAQWEWRRVQRSFGSKQRKFFVDELQLWNTALKNCFEKLELPAEDETIKVRELQGRFNPHRCDFIRENVEVIHQALKDSWNCGSPCYHHATINLDWQPDMSALPSVFDVALSFQDAPTHVLSAECRWRQLQINVQKMAATDIISSASTVQSLQGSAVPSVIPSRSLGKRTLSHAFTRTPNQNSTQVTFTTSVRNTTESLILSSCPTSDKISCLCIEVRKEADASGTLGYLSHPDHQQVKRLCLSHAPKTIPSIKESMPLKILLARQPILSRRLPPHLALSAKERYGLAAAVAWAVLHLSCTSWLNDAWGRDEVNVFLESTISGRERISQNPCISYLFETKATPPTLTSADHFSSNQIRNKTLFTLGILLIELCINKPFDELRTRGPTANTPPTIPDDFKMAESLIDEVYNEAGDSYGYAVQRCLRCEFPGRDVTKSLDFSTFRRHFYNTVVAPIQATYLRYPASCAAI